MKNGNDLRCDVWEQLRFWQLNKLVVPRNIPSGLWLWVGYALARNLHE